MIRRIIPTMAFFASLSLSAKDVKSVSLPAAMLKSRKTTHGNSYLRRTIIQCAWAASRLKDCFFSWFSYHQTVVRRKNKMKVIVAVARKMLVAVWHVLHDNVEYIDFKHDCEESANNG